MADLGPPFRYDKGVQSYWNKDTASRRAAQKISDFLILRLGLGAYPPEYNRAKHGPFDPRVKYTPTVPEGRIGDLQIKQLPEYISSRSWNPLNLLRSLSRGRVRWYMHYARARTPNPLMPLLQGIYLFLVPSFAYVHWTHAKHNTKFKHH